jgi:hypothetical protein
MVKRSKRLEKGIESLKKEIELHFSKIDCDINENKINLGRYHFKEIDLSLLASLENKLDLLGKKDSTVKEYGDRLNKLKDKLAI